jgi:hypothetical protein
VRVCRGQGQVSYMTATALIVAGLRKKKGITKTDGISITVLGFVRRDAMRKARRMRHALGTAKDLGVRAGNG